MAQKQVSTSMRVLVGASGPWVDANNRVYGILKTTGNALVAYKSGADPLVDTWTEQDSSNRPTATVPANDYAASWQQGTVIHCVAWDTTSGGPEYSTFGTSDNGTPDAWLTKDDLAVVPTAPIGNLCFIALRSDGDVIILHDGTREKLMGTDYQRCVYSRKEGGTWTATEVAVGNTGEQNHYAPVSIGRGASDRIWLAFSSPNAGGVSARALESDNTLGTGKTITSVINSTDNESHLLPYYDDDGVEVMTHSWLTGTAINTTRLRDGVAQTAVSIGITTSQPVCTSVTAGNAKKMYCSGKDSTSSDVYVYVSDDEGSWSSVGTIHTLVTSSAKHDNNVFMLNGNLVYGGLTQDSTSTYYNHIVLIALSSSRNPILFQRAVERAAYW